MTPRTTGAGLSERPLFAIISGHMNFNYKFGCLSHISCHKAHMSDKCTPFFLTEAPPPLPNGNAYRELAAKIREIARHTRLVFARRALLATSYQRRGDRLDRKNLLFDTFLASRVSLYSAVLSGALCLVMFTGPALANPIDPLADTMEVASQGMRSMTGGIFSQGMSVESGPWTGGIYSQGMMMTTGHIYSQGMEIMYLGATTFSRSQGGVDAAPNWSDNAPDLGGATNYSPPSQRCTATNCNSNGNGTITQTRSDPPKDEDTGSSNLRFTIPGGTPDDNSVTLELLHPKILFFDSPASDPPPPPSGGTAASAGDSVPEPASLALLGPALLWFGLVRRRRAAKAPS
jgi:hypothetical protein